MTTERAKQILASYGGNPVGWPQAERELLQQAIEQNPKLQALQQQALQLDEQLTQMIEYEQSQLNSVKLDLLESKILSRINQSERNHKIKKTSLLNSLSGIFTHYPHTQLAAALVLLLVCVSGLWQISTVSMQQSRSTQTQIALEQELWLMDQMLETPVENDFFALLEPELFEDESIDML